MIETDLNEVILQGIPGAPGICIGKAYLVDRENLDVVDKVEIPPAGVSTEVNRFKKAVKKADAQLAGLIKKTPKDIGQHVYILEAHRSLLKDKNFYVKTVDTVKRDRVNAEWALKTTVDDIKTLFSSIEDEYIRERIQDVVHVYNRVMRNLRGTKTSGIEKIDKRVILVAHDVSPAEASQLQLEWVKGFVTDLGGRTSHTTIVARTLQIPAVMGLGDATQRIRTEDIIIVDGAAGVVILHPEEQTLLRYEEKRDRFEEYQVRISKTSMEPAITTDGLRVYVSGNIELPEEVVAVKDKGGDGIGLYRTEFSYLNRRNLPLESELYDIYRDVMEVMGNRPVTIRTLDVNGDKVASGIMPDEGDNPALGLRAIRFCLKNQDIFKTQLRAILRASAHGRVRLLFPMISGVEELMQVNRLVAEAKAELEREDRDFDPDLETGVMIEIPSAAMVADLLAEHADFFSIGTNDLIQYCLAVDRGNKQVAHLFQGLHPAVIRLIKRVGDVAKDTGVRLAMCGEMAGDPLNIPLLLGMGFNELSMNPQAIPAVKATVRVLSTGECVDLVRAVMREKTARAVVDLIQEAYGGTLPTDRPAGNNLGKPSGNRTLH